MKKFSILFSLLIVFAMILAACSSGEENNESNIEKPGAGGNSPALEMTPSETGGSTGAFTGTETMTATLPTLEPTTAPLTGTTGITSTTETTGTTGANILPVTGEEGWSYLKTLMDMKVVDTKGDDIAGVNDAIVNLKSERVQYLIITTGGFLGIGEKAILIPWGAFAVQAKGENNTVSNSNVVTSTTSVTGTTGVAALAGDKVLVLNISKDDLKNAPDFNKNNIDFNKSDWDANFRSFWSSKVTTPFTDTTEVTGTGAFTSTNTVTGTGVTTGTAGTAMNLTDWIYASKLIGMNVQNSTGDKYGEIENAIVNEKSGKIDYAVVSAGGVLGIGEKEILVPLKMFSRGTTEDVLLFNGTVENLKSAPNFDKNMLPDLTGKNWDKTIKDYWNGLK